MLSEKCWAEAARIVYGTGRDQYEAYKEVLERRKGNPCSQQEQAGDWWDEELQMDRRIRKADAQSVLSG